MRRRQWRWLVAAVPVASRSNSSLRGNAFAKRYERLRQLCCHPAVSSQWAARLSGVGGGAGRDHTGSGIMSLEKLRLQLIDWKRVDAIGKTREAKVLDSHIVAAKAAAFKVVSCFRPRLNNDPSWQSLVRDFNPLGWRSGPSVPNIAPGAKVWRCIEDGAVFLCKSTSNVEAWLRSTVFTEATARAFLRTTAEWALVAAPAKRAEVMREAARLERGHILF